MIKGKNLQKYLKQSYGSCSWHIVSLCSRSVWSFNQIALTVFNLQSGQKIALSYVTRGMIWKKNVLWFLCMTCHQNVLYKCMKFLWNIPNGYQVIERTRFCDGQTLWKTDKWMDARGKQYVSRPFQGRDIIWQRYNCWSQKYNASTPWNKWED